MEIVKENKSAIINEDALKTKENKEDNVITSSTNGPLVNQQNKPQVTNAINSNIVRCSSCNKNLKLMPFTCKCKKDFCAVHRHDHGCTYDYRAEQKMHLEKTVTKVESEKIIRI